MAANEPLSMAALTEPDGLIVSPYLTDLGQRLAQLVSGIRVGQSLPVTSTLVGKAKATDVLMLQRDRVLDVWRTDTHEVVQTLALLLDASPPNKVVAVDVHLAQLKRIFDAVQNLRLSLLGMPSIDGYAQGRKLLADACHVWLERMVDALEQIVSVTHKPEQHVATTPWQRQEGQTVFNLRLDADLPPELRAFNQWWAEKNSRFGIKGWLALLGLAWWLG